MEKNSENFRNLHKVEMKDSNGYNFEILTNKVLSTYYEFYNAEIIERLKKNSEERLEKDYIESVRKNKRESTRDEDFAEKAKNERYIKSLEEILKVLPKEKVLDMIYRDYNNKKIPAKLVRRVIDIFADINLEKKEHEDLSKEKDEDLNEGKKEGLGEDSIEFRYINKEEESLFKLMQGKHPILKIIEKEGDEEEQK